MELLIGADPEFFLRDTETGKFVSAYGMIEGTKKNPQKVDCGAVQVDGMALEFNIDPAKTFKEFNYNIDRVLGQLRGMVDQRYEFVFESVADFDEDYIRNQPEEARQLGCEPDFNAYTGKPNPTPNANKNFRTASGHLHFGWTSDQDIKHPDHIEACQMLVKQLDSHLGLASVVIDPYSKRRELYGKAGAYRPKSYGVEYRTPSNVWLKDVEARRYMYDMGVKMFDSLVSGITYHRDGNQNVINQGDITRCYNRMGSWFSPPAYISSKYSAWKKEQKAKEITLTSGTAATSDLTTFLNAAWEARVEVPKRGRIIRDEFGRFAAQRIGLEF